MGTHIAGHFEKYGVCQIGPIWQIWKIFNNCIYKIKIKRESILWKQIANKSILWAVLTNKGSAKWLSMDQFGNFSTISCTTTHLFGAPQCGLFWTNVGVFRAPWGKLFWSNTWLLTSQIWADQFFWSFWIWNTK